MNVRKIATTGFAALGMMLAAAAAQAKTIACVDKCPLCIHTGMFSSVAACRADCKKKHTSGKNAGKGTQPVDAMCRDGTYGYGK